MEDVNHLTKLIKNPDIGASLEKIAEKWREESGALSYSRNPLIYFNLLLLTVAEIFAEVEKLSWKISELEKLLDKEYKKS